MSFGAAAAVYAAMAHAAIILDVGSLQAPDAGTIATLALLQLIAKRGGLELRLSPGAAGAAGADRVHGPDGGATRRAGPAARRAGTDARCRGRT